MSATVLTADEAIDAAMGYLQLGLRPIPLTPGDKGPRVKWAEYQHRQPHADEVCRWFDQSPTPNVGLALGHGILGVDMDGPNPEALLLQHGITLPADAPRVKSGRGQHVYLSFDPRLEIGCNDGLLAGADGSKIDIKADGGQFVAPPSIHPNGQRYAWVQPIPGIHPNGLPALPEIPDALLALLRSKGKVKLRGDRRPAPRPARPVSPETGAQGDEHWVVQLLNATVKEGLGLPGVAGGRDEACTKLAGYLINRGVSRSVARTILHRWASSNCDPPLDEEVVDKCLRSISRRDPTHGHASAEAQEQEAQEEAEGHPLGIRHISEYGYEQLARIEMGTDRFIPLPWTELNQRTIGGIEPGELVIIGAPPGTGKTAFTLQSARCAALAGKRTLVVTLEMSAAKMAERAAIQEVNLSSSAIRRGPSDPNWAVNRERFVSGLEKLSRLPLVISPLAYTLPKIVEAIEKSADALQGPVDFLVIDYLQYIQGRGMNQREDVEAVTKGLGVLAAQRDLPILLVSSLNRNNDDKEPSLSSLRESGLIAFAGSTVMFLFRNPGADENSGEFITNVKIAKSRNGPIGRMKLLFRGDLMQFVEVPEGYVEVDLRGLGRSRERIANIGASAEDARVFDE